MQQYIDSPTVGALLRRRSSGFMIEVPFCRSASRRPRSGQFNTHALFSRRAAVARNEILPPTWDNEDGSMPASSIKESGSPPRPRTNSPKLLKNSLPITLPSSAKDNPTSRRPRPPASHIDALLVIFEPPQPFQPAHVQTSS